jgi:hypothetical protein
MFITPDKMDGKRISYDYVVQQYEIQRLLQGHPLIALSNICKEITSGIRVKKEYYTNKNGYKIIAPGDIRNEIIYINELKVIQPEVVKEKDIINSGDILITASGKSGQVIYVNEALEGCVVTSDIIKITLRDRDKGIRLYSFLKSSIGQMLLNSIKIGILNKIFVEDAENLLIPEDFDTYQEDCSDDSTGYAEAEKLYRSAPGITTNNPINTKTIPTIIPNNDAGLLGLTFIPFLCSGSLLLKTLTLYYRPLISFCLFFCQNIDIIKISKVFITFFIII